MFHVYWMLTSWIPLSFLSAVWPFKGTVCEVPHVYETIVLCSLFRAARMCDCSLTDKSSNGHMVATCSFDRFFCWFFCNSTSLLMGDLRKGSFFSWNVHLFRFIALRRDIWFRYRLFWVFELSWVVPDGSRLRASPVRPSPHMWCAYGFSLNEDV